MAAAPAKVFVDHRFHYSCDVDLEVKVFVTCALLKCVNAGGRDAAQHASNASVTAQLVAGGLAMHPTPRRTQLPDKVTHAVFWNEWLSLPVKYNQLPVTAQLVRAVLCICTHPCLTPEPDTPCAGATSVGPRAKLHWWRHAAPV